MSSASTGRTEGSSPASSPASAASLAMSAPKFGTLVPNRIFVGGISASTSEAELAQLFSAYGNVKATKIISDRVGVSKGYGFVTFETDEEARRLQQESECIILRERKLNIAPAIKKQPFNRSFDGGSGSPPAVPTNAYYYANGMGLAYQNGLAFYNAGAPAPGTPIAPPTDPATLYQAAGVFGPQATSGHQTFAPVMYSCPAPSLYMPQQYQYSPMPYESYYAGVAAGGGPQQYALYANGLSQQQQQSQQSQSNGTGAGGGSVGGGGINGTGATSPPALGSLPPPPPPPGHFYAQSAPSGPQSHHHHHQPVAAAPPQPQPQLDHLYYSFAAPGPPPVPTQSQHPTIGIGEQPMLLYATDPNSCQQLSATTDNQATAQEDTRSTSSHSDQSKQQTDGQHQLQQQHAHQAQSQLPTTPLMSLMPLKYPVMPAPYANYHPLTMHPGSLQQHHRPHHAHNHHQNPGTPNVSNALNSERLDVEEVANHSQSVTATTYLYPATVYIPHGGSYPTAAGTSVGTSLLPTPGTPYEKLHHSAQSGKHGVGINSSIGINLGYSRTPNSYSIIGGVQPQSYPKTPGYSRKYSNYQGTSNPPDRSRYYASKAGVPSQQYSYVTPRPGIFTSQIITSFGGNPNSSYNGPNYARRNLNDQWSESYDSPVNRYGNSRRRDSSGHGRGVKSRDNHEATQMAGKSCAASGETVESRLAVEENVEKSAPTASIAVTDRNNKSPIIKNNNNNNCSPPPAPYSPMTPPIPNVSPPVSQVQFYASGNQAQARYHQPQLSHHQSQQQQSGQRRFGGLGQSANPNRRPSSQSGGGELLRRPKNKVNCGLISGSVGKLQEDNCLGGGGDATGVSIANRMPITPPPTPRTTAVGNANNANLGGNDSSQITDACHQLQALSL